MYYDWEDWDKSLKHQDEYLAYLDNLIKRRENGEDISKEIEPIKKRHEKFMKELIKGMRENWVGMTDEADEATREKAIEEFERMFGKVD